MPRSDAHEHRTAPDLTRRVHGPPSTHLDLNIRIPWKDCQGWDHRKAAIEPRICHGDDKFSAPREALIISAGRAACRQVSCREEFFDAIYDSYAMCRFKGLDSGVEQVPDATTLMHFRHLLEKHGRGKALFESQNQTFDEQDWIMRGGSIVDATIIAAPSSTKNATGARDRGVHNRKRRHSSLGMLTPTEYETMNRVIHVA